MRGEETGKRVLRTPKKIVQKMLLRETMGDKMSNDVEMYYEEMAQDNAELERENELLSRENAALVERLNYALDGGNDSVLELSKFRSPRPH